MMRLFGFAYDLAFFVFGLMALPSFLLKGKHRGPAATRFGLIRPELLEPVRGKTVVWLHAVSVGEVIQAMRLREAMALRRPDLGYVLTVTTATGYDVARTLAGDRVALLYFPVDLGVCVRAFLNRVRPALTVILETEIWPNLLTELRRREIPVLVVNGRISDRAAVSYRAFRFFLAPFFGMLNGVLAQDETMRGRFVEAGTDPSRVEVTGNMKYDWSPSASATERARPIEAALGRLGGPVWIAGSTHEGEEEAVLEAHRRAAARVPGLTLVLAPRHPQRFAAAEQAIVRAGFACARSTDPEGSTRWSGGSVLLLDQMGILSAVYRAADAVFVGGSLVPVGGHNLVEPAYFGKPVLYGPHTANFAQMCEAFERAGGAFRVRSAPELAAKLVELLSDPAALASAGEAARRLIESHRGATEKNIDRLLGYVR